MKHKKVWLMCGCPASGKSTWIKQNMNPKTDIWCSRDQVRFSLVKEEEDYFAKETEVVNTWISNICAALADSKVENIFVDATHLTPNARKKVLNRLPLQNTHVIAVVMKTPLFLCLKRNKNRKGRECVPNSVIRKMFNSFSVPTKTEYNYHNIITVKTSEGGDKEK